MRGIPGKHGKGKEEPNSLLGMVSLLFQRLASDTHISLEDRCSNGPQPGSDKKPGETSKSIFMVES